MARVYNALHRVYTLRMAMGKRDRQPSMWVATTDFPMLLTVLGGTRIDTAPELYRRPVLQSNCIPHHD
jgi:hypothetical protein